MTEAVNVLDVDSPLAEECTLPTALQVMYIFLTDETRQCNYLIFGRDGSLVKLGEFLHDGLAARRCGDVCTCHTVLRQIQHTGEETKCSKHLTTFQPITTHYDLS